MLIQQNEFYSQPDAVAPHPLAGCTLGAGVTGVIFLYTPTKHVPLSCFYEVMQLLCVWRALIYHLSMI